MLTPLLEQSGSRGFAVLAQSNACVQWLIVHRVARKPVHVRSMGKQQCGCFRSAKCRCQMERGPAISGGLMNKHGVLPQQRLEAGAFP